MKTQDEIRAEAAEAARADMRALKRHFNEEVECPCGPCTELLGAQFRWHWERIARESLVPVGTPLGQLLPGTPVATWPFRPLPVEIVPPPPPHVHTPAQGSGIPYCTTCGQALEPFKTVFTVDGTG